MVNASICIATHNKPRLLQKTLQSIYRQKVPFDFETIVVDDGPKDNATRDVCSDFPLQYHRIEREPIRRNPSVARNVGFKKACGNIIIAQSDDVVHASLDCITRLVQEIKPGTILFAHVFSQDEKGNLSGVYTGPEQQVPFFFLGSLYRKDLYAVGGNDEEFVCPAWEDNWFGDCLIQGCKLTPIYSTHIVAHHLCHRGHTSVVIEMPSKVLYHKKVDAAKRGKTLWQSSGGPWPYKE